jgi:hypothetical protein
VFLYTRDGAAPADLREVLEGLVSAAGRSSDRRSSRKRQVLESLDIKEAGDHAVRVGFALPLGGAQ